MKLCGGGGGYVRGPPADFQRAPRGILKLAGENGWITPHPAQPSDRFHLTGILTDSERPNWKTQNSMKIELSLYWKFD